jgi:hypothetical protein
MLPQHRWRPLAVFVMLALSGAPAGQALAQTAPPPPAGQLQAPMAQPPAPAQPQAVLYAQMDSPSASQYISSNNATDDQYDTRAADDFQVSSVLNSWQVTAVEVSGLFSFGSGPHSVNQVNVAFYADAGGAPGYQVYTTNALPLSGTASSGAFFVPLNPAAGLAAHAKYWVSVQAVQSTSWYWYWGERSIQALSAARWQNPSGVLVASCTHWTAVDVCYPGSSGPDLLFRLYGTQSAKAVPPPLYLPVVRR